MKCRALFQVFFGLALLLHGPAALAALCSEVWSASNNGVNGGITAPTLPDFMGADFHNADSLTDAGSRYVLEGVSRWSGGVAPKKWKLIAPSSGTARVFVKGNLELDDANNVGLNAEGKPENLVLIIDGDLVIKNNVVIRGFVFVTGKIEFKNNATLYGGFSANGLIIGKNNTKAEFDAAALARTDFSGICDEGSSWPPVDHFEFLTSTGAHTCSPHAVTVKACTNATGACQLFPGDVPLTLAGNGWVGGPKKVLQGGTGIFRLQGLQINMPLAVEPMAISPAGASRCFLDGQPSRCIVEFRQSGFVFDDLHMAAGRGSSGFMRAVVDRGALGSPRCEPAFVEEPRQIRFQLEGGTQALDINNTPISATPVALELYFDKDGKTPLLNLNYAEAGQLTLRASYDGSADEEDSGLMWGSQAFVSTPAGFCIQALQQDGSVRADCSGPTCEVYRKTGQPFDLRLYPVAWKDYEKVGAALCDNPITRDFRSDNPIKLEMRVLDTEVNENPEPQSVDFSTQATQVLDQSVNEVGRFEFSIPSSTFHGQLLPGGSSAPVGRFVPDSFRLDYSYQPGCTDFSYAGLESRKKGQPFTFAAKVTAVNHVGDVTKNYEGDYAQLESGALKLTPREAGQPFLNNEVRIIETHAFQFDKGVAEVVFDDPYMEFAVPREPLQVRLHLSAEDLDGVKGEVLGEKEQRFLLGRLRIGNSHGSELQDLAVPVRAEYFNGLTYEPNAMDNCTPFNPADLEPFTRSGSGSGKPELSYPDTNKGVGNSYQLKAGYGTYLLSAPGVGGSQGLSFKEVPDWLKFDWNDTVEGLEPPSGLATFGIYKGSNPLILRREVYR